VPQDESKKVIYPTTHKLPTAADFFDEELPDQKSSEEETSVGIVPQKKRNLKIGKKGKKGRKGRKGKEERVEIRFDEADYVKSAKIWSNQQEYFQYEQGEQVTILRWVVDFFGDEQNREYGIVNRGKVPRFRRKTKVVIGEPDDEEAYRVISELDELMGIKHSKRHKNRRYFQSKPSISTLSILSSSQPYDQDFIPISSLASFSLDNEYNEYNEDNKEEAMLKSNKHYSSLLQQHPEDTSLWLEFLNSQDSFYTKKSVLLEKKLSILDKVLSDPPPSLYILPLILEQLKLFEQKLLTEYEGLKAVGENELASNRLSELYRYYLSRFPDARDLWRKYLVFCSTEYTKFTVSNFREVINICINLLKPLSKELEFREIMIDICCFAANVKMLSGFEERAIGIYVGLLEFCAVREELKELGFGDKLREYEKIWESDQDKLGYGAVTQKINEQDMEARTFEEWFEKEKKCEIGVGLRHDDDMADRYPDSVVLFEDILPYLLPFQLSESDISTLIVNLLNLFKISLPDPSPSQLFKYLDSYSSMHSTLGYYPSIPPLSPSIHSFLCNLLFSLSISNSSHSHSIRWRILVILLESSVSSDYYTKQILASSNSLSTYIAYMHSSSSPSRIYSKIYKSCTSSLFNKLWITYVYFLDRLDSNEDESFECIYRIQGSNTSNYLKNLVLELVKEEHGSGVDCRSVGLVLSMWCVYYEEGVRNLIRYVEKFREEMDEMVWYGFVRIVEYCYNKQEIFKRELSDIVLYALKKYPNNSYFFRLYVDLNLTSKLLLLPKLKQELHLSQTHWQYLIPNLPFLSKLWILNETRQDSTDPNCIFIWSYLLSTSPPSIQCSMVRQAVIKHPSVKQLYLFMNPEEAWMHLTEKELRVKVNLN
jgi:hypothetical protein